MKYKVTYLIETFEHTEDTPVMDFSYWGNNIDTIPKSLLDTRIIEYQGEPLDEGWQAYQSEVLDIQGDIVDWEEVH